MSFNRGKEPSAIPLSPSFAPRKLGFGDEDDDEISQLRTPHSQTRNRAIRSKENEPPETPLSQAKDSQYKEWLQRNGFYELFRNTSVVSSVIKVLRQYSLEICEKVEQILQTNNNLNRWKTEIGEPALDTVERYKLIEKELKNEQLSLTDEYNRKNTQCDNLKNELLNLRNEILSLQNEISDIFKPKIKEYDNLLQAYNKTQKQLTNLQNENANLQNTQSEQTLSQTTEIIQVNKINKGLNKQINVFQAQISKQKHEIDQLNNDLHSQSQSQSQSNNLELELSQMQTQQQQPQNHQNVAADNDNDNDMHLPALFHQHQSSGFDWDFEADDDDETVHDNDNDNDHDNDLANIGKEAAILKYRDILGVDKLMLKIDGLQGLQEQETQKTIANIKQSYQKQLAEFAKLHSRMKHVCQEQQKHHQIHQTLSLSQWEDAISKHVQKSMDTSFSSICSPQNNAKNINVISEKLDSLTKYLQTLEIDRRIITVYRKIESKIDDLSANNLKTNDLQKLLHGIQFKQESQQSAIDNSLASFRELFEKELNQIIKFICDRQKEHKNASNLQKKVTKPVILHNQISNNNNNLMSINCNRLNEMFMSEFVMVLINEICHASDDSFDKLLGVMFKIIHDLHSYSMDSIYSKTKYDKIECILVEYKSEIDNLFITIFQNTINNICRDLMNDKMQRIKLQSRIAKLTNRFIEKGNKNKKQNKTLSKTQSKKIFQQFHTLSLKHFFLPLGVVVIFTFLCGLCFGCCLLPSQPQNHPFM